MNTNTTEILDRLDRATTELHAASIAAIRLARSIDAESAASKEDDDQWLRMPISPKRCAISSWSRSTIENHGKAGDIRTKLVDGKRYYSGADVRKHISSTETAPG